MAAPKKKGKQSKATQPQRLCKCCEVGPYNMGIHFCTEDNCWSWAIFCDKECGFLLHTGVTETYDHLKLIASEWMPKEVYDHTGYVEL